MLRSLVGLVGKDSRNLRLFKRLTAYQLPSRASSNVLKSDSSNTSIDKDATPIEVKTDTDPNMAVVLDFFNTCDHVTLRKLRSLKPAYFKGVELVKVIQTGVVSKRFESIDSLLNVVPVKLSSIPEIAKLILKLSRKERSNTGIKGLYPEFPRNQMKRIRHVVSVDVFQNQVAWVGETCDRVMIDAGHHVMFDEKFKFVYNHVQHQQELHTVLRMIPEADVYLLHTRCNKQPVHKNQQKYAIHQSIMEALLVTLLNSRGQPVSRTAGIHELLEQPHSEIPDDQDIREPAGEKAVNHVHMVDKAAFQDFYDDIVLGPELLSSRNIVQNWLEGKGALKGLVSDMAEYEMRELFKGSGGDQISQCLLMADMFCKCIQKVEKEFPRQYSYEDDSYG